jgi:hypothetical protein
MLLSCINNDYIVIYENIDKKKPYIIEVIFLSNLNHLPYHLKELQMDRDSVLKALREEIEAVDSADGKGVAAKEPKEMKTPSDATKSEKVKLDGGGGTVGGDGGGVEKGGKAAEGADKPAIDKADGKSVASAKVGEAKVGGGTDGKAMEKADGKSVASASTGKAKFGGGTDGKAMEKADGKGVAVSTVKASPDLKGDNTVGENIILPHDVLVEMNGKKMTLKAGTKVTVVKEGKKDEECEEDDKECKDKKVVKEEEGDVPEFLKDKEEDTEVGKEEVGKEGEGADEGAELPEFGSEVDGEVSGEDIPEIVGAVDTAEGPEEIAGTALDQIVNSLDSLADGFREFAQEEKAEEEHGGEGGAEAAEEKKEEIGDTEFTTQLESINKKAKLIK